MTGPAPRVGTNHYLDGLLDEVARLAASVAAAPADERGRLAERRRVEAATATLVLDGADAELVPDLERARALADETPSHVVTTAATDGTPSDGARADAPTASWLDAFGIAHDASDEHLRAHELLGALAGLDATDLVPIGAGGLEVLRELHARLTTGLVAPERAGVERTRAQAVHDASVGRVLYLTTEPPAIAGELSALGVWLRDVAPTMHPVVAAGVLHGELLRIHPFDAANGRLARTAARHVMRAGGADPDGLAAPEVALATDPMRYHQAMADTLRRRDLTRFVEHWAEAVADGLRRSARELGGLAITVPDRAATFVADRASFTLGDYLELVGHDRQVAARELEALLDAGAATRVLGTHGLRFHVAGSADDPATGPVEPAAPWH